MATTKKTAQEKKDDAALKGVKVCPFCRTKPKAMVMFGHLGYCCYIGCENKKCLVNPKSGMINAKSSTKAVKLAREQWENRTKK